jgi:hypothetical protein
MISSENRFPLFRIMLYSYLTRKGRRTLIATPESVSPMSNLTARRPFREVAFGFAIRPSAKFLAHFSDG